MSMNRDRENREFDDSRFITIACPECEGLIQIDADFAEQVCPKCGETFYDESSLEDDGDQD